MVNDDLSASRELEIARRAWCQAKVTGVNLYHDTTVNPGEDIPGIFLFLIALATAEIWMPILLIYVVIKGICLLFKREVT